tara:strand:- start:4449 stop:4688 length:240 start_codon:yes stop_codon:yes gene_type:complete
MPKLHCHRNTYKVVQDDIEKGYIRFIRYADDASGTWKIEEASEGVPVMKSHHNAEIAKRVLIQNGFRWVAGKNEPFYKL